jgi:hypothetical protein
MVYPLAFIGCRKSRSISALPAVAGFNVSGALKACVKKMGPAQNVLHCKDKACYYFFSSPMM